MVRQVDKIRDELEQLIVGRRNIDKMFAEKQEELLRSLHETVSLPSTDALVRALWAHTTPKLRAELIKRPRESRGPRGKRYTEATKVEVRRALEELHQTPANVRRAFSIGNATLAKWMKEWGIPTGRQGRPSANGATESVQTATG